MLLMKFVGINQSETRKHFAKERAVNTKGRISWETTRNMSSSIEKDILRKVHDAGFTFKASTFKEATDEDLNGLFVSLITVYDTTWKFDSAKNVKQVRRNIMK